MLHAVAGLPDNADKIDILVDNFTHAFNTLHTRLGAFENTESVYLLMCAFNVCLYSRITLIKPKF